MFHSLFIHGIIVRKDFGQNSNDLLVVAKEDLDGQPAVSADLEALRQRVDLLHLLIGQLPAVELEVTHDAGCCDGLGDDAGAALETPHEQDLLNRLSLAVGELLELLVLVERRVGGAEAGVGGAVDALLLAVVEELGAAFTISFHMTLYAGKGGLRGVVGVELNLVNGRSGLEARVGEELLEVGDGKVGDTNVLHAARLWQLLKLSPRVLEVPVRVVLLEVIWVRGRRPMLLYLLVLFFSQPSCHHARQTHHEVKVNVVETKALQRAGDALFNALVPWVVKLRSDPDLLTGDTGVLDTLTDLLLVAVGKRGVDVAVSSLERGLDGFADLTGL